MRLSPNNLTFAPGNWNIAQTVTITSRGNSRVEGDARYGVTVSVDDGASAEAFAGLSNRLIGMVTDDDVAGFTLAPIDGSTLETLLEGENITTFTVRLNAQPLSDVLLDIITMGSDVTVSRTSLTILSRRTDWLIPQTVTVTSRADNSTVDGDAAYTVTVSVDDRSTDAFDGLADQTLNGMVTDDDVAGFTLDPSDGSSLADLAEGSNTLTFTVVLGAQPLSDVVF